MLNRRNLESWRAAACAGALSLALGLAGCSDSAPQVTDQSRRWLAGDHHIHSQFSLTYDSSGEEPVPVLRGHGIYPIPHNAVMAQHFGLDWMVSTDHGGRAHARISLEEAYPTLLIARQAVPELIHYYGVELNPPGADHASVIVPRSADEADQIFMVESQFDRVNGPGRPPLEPDADSESRMLEALEFMQTLPEKPVVIANHPARTANDDGFGRTGAAELRQWNDTAPDIAIGMEGSPGHQAAGLMPERYPKRPLLRGNYPRIPTRGGFDLMTAELGGVWDSMLGEGRGWWITGTSDSHRHWSEGGNDFWPGEYSKTYVYASKTYSGILQSLREGRVFVTTGDLISELELSVAAEGAAAAIGDRLEVGAGSDMQVTIRVRDPSAANANGDNPSVARVDLIAGNVDPALIAAAGDINPGTGVVRRFTEADWARDGEYLSMTHELADVRDAIYLRVRGTSTDELEPEPDLIDEDPWQDLWFYSNPVFVLVSR
ncbi:MAG TPA: phosphoesterase [Gammaproteobacteria bacterium]